MGMLRPDQTWNPCLLGFLLCILAFPGSSYPQAEEQEPPLAKKVEPRMLPDVLLPPINAAIQGVTAPDVSALAKALHVGEKTETAAPGGPYNTLANLGDLDGDGVPEMLLAWALPEVAGGVQVAPAPDSAPLWSLYLLSWEGARWNASPLLTEVEDFTHLLISLGTPAGRNLVIVTLEGDSQAAYPAIFQIKGHTASLLWDAQADDSRYEPLLQGRVHFQDHGNAAADMVVTGRADPGLLQVEPKGRRGFQARRLYHWDGKAFVSVKTEYFAGPDYTVYRFIAALHLHDFRSAYAQVDPGKFLSEESPTLQAFRQVVENQWSEFLENGVFPAPETPAGSADEHLFALTKASERFVYHPTFSSDGKFLLTGLTRTREALPAER